MGLEPALAMVFVRTWTSSGSAFFVTAMYTGALTVFPSTTKSLVPSMFRSAESLMEEIMAQSAVPSSTAFRHSFGDSKVSTSHRGYFFCSSSSWPCACSATAIR